MLRVAERVAAGDLASEIAVLGRDEMAALGMGALLGVSRGSTEDPRFIIMEYWGAGKNNPTKTGAKDPIVFAMANPNPEIRPEQCDGLAAVMATGRSDYPNQINNVLAFPFIFRGAMDVRATQINDAMKVAAAHALADDAPIGIAHHHFFGRRVGGDAHHPAGQQDRKSVV